MSGTHQSGGVGFFGLLTIVFITLKVTGVINWSWWLVLSPVWCWLAAVILAFGIWLLATALIDARRNH